MIIFIFNGRAASRFPPAPSGVDEDADRGPKAENCQPRNFQLQTSVIQPDIGGQRRQADSGFLRPSRDGVVVMGLLSATASSILIAGTPYDLERQEPKRSEILKLTYPQAFPSLHYHAIRGPVLVLAKAEDRRVVLTGIELLDCLASDSDTLLPFWLVLCYSLLIFWPWTSWSRQEWIRTIGSNWYLTSASSSLMACLRLCLQSSIGQSLRPLGLN